jgi:hypothetical protein
MDGDSQVVVIKSLKGEDSNWMVFAHEIYLLS